MDLIDDLVLLKLTGKHIRQQININRFASNKFAFDLSQNSVKKIVPFVS